MWTSKKCHRTLHVYYDNITCILRKHRKIQHRTLYAYHVNIKKHQTTSHVQHVNIKKHRTSHVYYENIACILHEHRKIHYRTLHAYHVNIKNITCIARQHKKKHRISHIYTTWTSKKQQKKRKEKKRKIRKRAKNKKFGRSRMQMTFNQIKNNNR